MTNNMYYYICLQYQCEAPPRVANQGYVTTPSHVTKAFSCEYKDGDTVTCRLHASTAIGYGPFTQTTTITRCNSMYIYI